MKYRPLGATGLFVSELCLGTMTFGGKDFWAVVGTQGQADVDVLVGRTWCPPGGCRKSWREECLTSHP